MISILLLWLLYVIKIGPVEFQRQAEQLWHWLVEQEVVHCRSLPLQKYDYSQPKVILCDLILTNNLFACWFVWGIWLWLWLLRTKADDSEAPTIVAWEGERNSAWKEILVWILLQEVGDLLDLMATETNTRDLNSNSCNPIRSHNVTRTSKKHTVNNHEIKYFYGCDDSSLDTAQGSNKMLGRKSTGRFISSWI